MAPSASLQGAPCQIWGQQGWRCPLPALPAVPACLVRLSVRFQDSPKLQEGGR